MRRKSTNKVAKKNKFNAKKRHKQSSQKNFLILKALPSGNLIRIGANQLGANELGANELGANELGQMNQGQINQGKEGAAAAAKKGSIRKKEQIV